MSGCLLEPDEFATRALPVIRAAAWLRARWRRLQSRVFPRLRQTTRGAARILRIMMPNRVCVLAVTGQREDRDRCPVNPQLSGVTKGAKMATIGQVVLRQICFKLRPRNCVPWEERP
jgi:hypothetical protein